MTDTQTSAIASEFSIRIEQIDGFEFRVRFDKEQYAELRVDEPAPLGHDVAPNAARILAAAVGNCLSASLVFCLKRRGVKVEGLATDVHVTIVRNETKRLRVGAIDVKLHPSLAGHEAELAACISTFEDFCMVTESVRHGIVVNVAVESGASHPSAGG